MNITFRNGAVVQFDNREEAIAYLMRAFPDAVVSGHFAYVGLRMVASITPENL